MLSSPWSWSPQSVQLVGWGWDAPVECLRFQMVNIFGRHPCMNHWLSDIWCLVGERGTMHRSGGQRCPIGVALYSYWGHLVSVAKGGHERVRVAKSRSETCKCEKLTCMAEPSSLLNTAGVVGGWCRLNSFPSLLFALLLPLPGLVVLRNANVTSMTARYYPIVSQWRLNVTSGMPQYYLKYGSI